jgi:raffinose/stachyose/melibiose transport system substrate-binding protein
MKKALVILLALVLLTATAFAGDQAKTKGPVVVKTLAYGDNSNQEGQNWVRIVESFEAANPDIDIDFEMLYDEAYHQKASARLASGDIPHIAYMGADARWGAIWKEAGQQVDHRDFMDSNYYDMSLIPPMGDNGEVWEIPLGTSNLCTVLYMNTELVKSLGFAEPKTYEDMVAMVGAAQAAGLEVVSIDGADGWAWGSCLMSSIIARLSGDPNWVKKAVEGENKFTDQVMVDSLAMLTKMVADGVISDKSVLVDYGTNISNFSNKKALFMVQGQWAAGGIDKAVADVTKMMVWPTFPGEKAGAKGSIAAATQVGYGLTKAGADDAAVRAAALKFIKYYNSEAEVTQRLRDGGIVAPILKGYVPPDDLPAVIKSKVALAQSGPIETNVIDAYLSGAPNDALNAGMQQIVVGEKTAAQVAAEVEGLLRP